MSVQFEVEYGTSMYRNLRDEWRGSEYYGQGSWHDYVRSLPGVIGVSTSIYIGGTVIEIDSEAAKTWFILRWS